MKALLIAAAAAASFALVPALAQSPLVNVQVNNVANNIAKNISVDVSQVPVSVKVPVAAAATVCGVAADVLGTQAASGNAACSATSTNSALDQIVLRQIKGGTQG